MKRQTFGIGYETLVIGCAAFGMQPEVPGTVPKCFGMGSGTLAYDPKYLASNPKKLPF